MDKYRAKRRALGALRAEGFFVRESLRINGRGLLLGLVVGLLVGLWGGLFADLLDWAAGVRNDTAWAIYGLPLAGLAVVWLYRRGASRPPGAPT